MHAISQKFHSYVLSKIHLLSTDAVCGAGGSRGGGQPWAAACWADWQGPPAGGWLTAQRTCLKVNTQPGQD